MDRKLHARIRHVGPKDRATTRCSLDLSNAQSHPGGIERSRRSKEAAATAAAAVADTLTLISLTVAVQMLRAAGQMLPSLTLTTAGPIMLITFLLTLLMSLTPMLSAMVLV